MSASGVKPLVLIDKEKYDSMKNKTLQLSELGNKYNQLLSNLEEKKHAAEVKNEATPVKSLEKKLEENERVGRLETKPVVVTGGKEDIKDDSQKNMEEQLQMGQEIDTNESVLKEPMEQYDINNWWKIL